MHHDDDEHRQPWEETFSENSSRNMSRMARKRRKNGNTIFTSVLIIAILILALLPVGYYISNMSNFNHPTEESSQTSISSSSSVKHHEKKNRPKENVQNDSKTDKQNESSASTTSGSQNAKYVTLQQNQGLYAIAKEHGISLQKLMELNGFNTPTPSLHPGYKIRIK